MATRSVSRVYAVPAIVDEHSDLVMIVRVWDNLDKTEMAFVRSILIAIVISGDLGNLECLYDAKAVN